MKKRIVIIGGCAAGPKTAAKSRRIDSETEILMYTKGDNVSYSACGMPYYVGGSFNDINKLIVRTPEEFAKSNIQVFLKNECTKILPHSKEVIVNDRKIHYDELVLAIGANPSTPNIKNLNLENIHHMRVLKDGENIKKLAKESKSVLIVGFGYIALEMIEAFLRNGLRVYVIENNPHIMSFLDDEFGDLIEEHIKGRDGDLVEIIKDDSVTEFIGKIKFEGAITKKGVMIKADFCIIATGVNPNVDIARECGINIGITGGIKVDKKMRTNIPHIWAAGDCTEKHCIITKLPTYAALGSIANKEGRVCAINLNDGSEYFDGVLGSAVTKYFNYTVAVTGITERRANEAAQKIDLEPISAVITKLDKASYMPEANSITIKLLADKRSGELLGAQGVGLGDVDKRISIVTSALQKKMTIDDFIHLDLTYAPPTSGTIDPLLTACYELRVKMNQ